MLTRRHLSAARHPWVYRASIAQLVISAALIGLLFWVINAGLDLLWAIYNGPTVWAMSIVDALLSIVFGVLALKLMLAQRARHRKVVQQLEMIAEMNHHIRNALESIQLSAHFTHDRQFISEIHDAVDRIQWALREVLPKTSGDR
jgi:signal transduction histidine kinase